MHKLFKLYTLNMCVCMLSDFSHIQLFATIWTVARQASLSMGFSRQEYWSALLQGILNMCSSLYQLYLSKSVFKKKRGVFISAAHY